MYDFYDKKIKKNNKNKSTRFIRNSYALQLWFQQQEWRLLCMVELRYRPYFERLTANE